MRSLSTEQKGWLMQKEISPSSLEKQLLSPLAARKMAMDLYPDLFYDEDCVELLERMDFEVAPPVTLQQKIGAIMAATREYDMAEICRKYILSHPEACVVNMGCGLDTTFNQVDNGSILWYNIDFPEVIAVRNRLLPPKDREINIACDLHDLSWFDDIYFNRRDGAVFFGSGVFHYFTREKAKVLFCGMAKRFPGGKLAFDSTSYKGIKRMLFPYLRPGDRRKARDFFFVQSEGVLRDWTRNFALVKRKGLMTGYRKLDERYGMIPNLMLRMGDMKKMSQIIEIDFRR